MGTGRKRGALGDIVFVPEGAQLVVDKTYQLSTGNLHSIGAPPITMSRNR